MASSPTITQQGDQGTKTLERSSLLGFITDSDSENAIQDGLAELVPSIQLRRASVRQATALLRKMPSPEVLIVDISGEDAPLAALHDLSEVVEPSTRVLVVGDQVIAAARRFPAHVIGDGASTVRALVERANQDPARGEGHEKPMTRIRLDEAAEHAKGCPIFAGGGGGVEVYEAIEM